MALRAELGREHVLAGAPHLSHDIRFLQRRGTELGAEVSALLKHRTAEIFRTALAPAPRSNLLARPARIRIALKRSAIGRCVSPRLLCRRK